MPQLTEAERSCLRKIADEPSADAPPCPDDILKRLLALKLIDCQPKLWAPLESVDVRYHLTDRGEALLHRLGPAE